MTDDAHCPLGLPERAFETLVGAYRRKWSVALCAIDAEGRIVMGRASCHLGNCDACCSARAFSLQEALRWGEPTVSLCPRNALLWAQPLMHNEITLGALLATVDERRALGAQPPLDVRAACRDLLAAAERANWTNASYLRARREATLREQERAYAIHSFKRENHNSIRELYIREEPALFAAIRAGDRGEARAILNRILVVIHHHAGSRLDLIKSHFLELLVTMSRTAVQSGGDPAQLLGRSGERLTALAGIDSDQDLARWFRESLEALMDAVETTRQRDTALLVHEALAYMERRCGEHISRDDVAAAVGLSPGHFSTVFKRETGATFTDMLNRMRVDRAARLLRRSEMPLALVALECGFGDQAYFTNVFGRIRGTTPRQYRQAAVRSDTPAPRSGRAH